MPFFYQKLQVNVDNYPEMFLHIHYLIKQMMWKSYIDSYSANLYTNKEEIYSMYKKGQSFEYVINGNIVC